MSGASSPTSSLGSPSRPIFARRPSSNGSLSLDLSSLPPLQQPSPPSNTLLITNLDNVDIFRPDNLQTIRALIEKTAPIHTWSPLKSFRRIVVSFYDEQAAIDVRQVWDHETIMGQRTRVYFGQTTPLNQDAKDQHLELPDAGKLFFISPPPSPPHGWEQKLEDAPNTMVHADDLADALAKLHHRPAPEAALVTPVSPVDGASFAGRTRSRSSTLIYQPSEHGGSPGLPAISVDDMTDSPDALSLIEKPILAHTSRPPVELIMSDA